MRDEETELEPSIALEGHRLEGHVRLEPNEDLKMDLATRPTCLKNDAHILSAFPNWNPLVCEGATHCWFHSAHLLHLVADFDSFFEVRHLWQG